MLNFEERIFRQEAYWTSRLSIELVSKQIKLELLANPENKTIEGWILFKEINNLEIEFLEFYEEGFDDSVEDLIGIIDETDPNGTRYTITTSTVEISFVTKIEPNVNWIDPLKPKQEFKREKLRMP